MSTKKQKESVNYYSLSGIAKFKGFVKNGLDSSTLIKIIVVFDSDFSEFKRRGFAFPPNLFYYHEISWPETIGILINKHKFTKEEAKNSLKKLIKQFNLQKIKRNALTDESYETLVEEANQRVVDKYQNPNLRIGDQDIIIIGGFLRSKINFVHSGDKGFLKTCEELGLNTIPLPKKAAEKEKQIKNLMKKGRS